MSYTPRVDDYVIWNTTPQTFKGWVYFKCEDYITIEISVKDKPDELVNFHKKIHCLLLCFRENWNELEYVKNRREEEDSYKAQEYRYADVQ